MNDKISRGWAPRAGHVGGWVNTSPLPGPWPIAVGQLDRMLRTLFICFPSAAKNHCGLRFLVFKFRVTQCQDVLGVITRQFLLSSTLFSSFLILVEANLPAQIAIILRHAISLTVNYGDNLLFSLSGCVAGISVLRGLPKGKG